MGSSERPDASDMCAEVKLREARIFFEWAVTWPQILTSKKNLKKK